MKIVIFENNRSKTSHIAAKKLGFQIIEPTFKVTEIAKDGFTKDSLSRNFRMLLKEYTHGTQEDEVKFFPMYDETATILAACAASDAELSQIINGPKLESILIPNYKPAVFSLLMKGQQDQDHLVVPLVHWNNANKDEQQLLVERVSYPCFIKPTAGAASALVARRDSPEELKQFLNEQAIRFFSKNEGTLKMWSLFNSTFEILKNVMQKGIMNELGPVHHPSFIIEPFRNASLTVDVDLLVWDGHVAIQNLSDDLYHSDTPSIVGVSSPSMLPDAIQDDLKQKSLAIVDKLVRQYGFDNQFINFQWFVLPSPDKNKPYVTKLMEINPRVFAMVDIMFGKLNNTSYAEHFLKLIGHIEDQPTSPVPKFGPTGKPLVGFCGYLATFEGAPMASELLNYDEAAKIQRNDSNTLDPTTITIVTEKAPDEEITVHGSAGENLALAYVAGESMEECLQKFMPLYNAVLKPEARGLLKEVDMRKPLVPQVLGHIHKFLGQL